MLVFVLTYDEGEVKEGVCFVCEIMSMCIGINVYTRCYILLWGHALWYRLFSKHGRLLPWLKNEYVQCAPKAETCRTKTNLHMSSVSFLCRSLTNKGLGESGLNSLMMNPEKSKVVAKKFHPSKVSASGEQGILYPFKKTLGFTWFDMY